MPHSTVVRSTTIDGQEIDVATLETIDFGRLAAKEPAEVEKLLNASQMPGFFYLDLQNEQAEEILASLPGVYAVIEKYFDEPPEGETKYLKEGQDSSYKPGEQQRAFEILRDKMIQGTLALPPTLQHHAKLLERFFSLCHSVNQTMLSCLSDALKLDDVSRFENSHRDDKSSDTAFNIYYAPAKRKRDGVDTTHTDGGTLTLLFGDHWGIMMEHPETKAWTFVEPRPGCALINVADSLQSLSGNKLHSCRHRITQPVDGFQKRYYIVAYLRPENAI